MLISTSTKVFAAIAGVFLVSTATYAEDCRVSDSPRCQQWRAYTEQSQRFYTDTHLRSCEYFGTCNLPLNPNVPYGRGNLQELQRQQQNQYRNCVTNPQLYVRC